MNSSPSSPTIQKRSSIPPPWNSNLVRSYNQNYAKNNTENIYLPMCNMKRSGEISMHCLAFKGILQEDFKFFKFLLAMNDNILMGDIKSNPNAKINWMMPNTKEYYNFKGKFYIQSAPIQVTRFPPPKIMSEEDDNEGFWENHRIKQWNELDNKTRATFTWPSRGETPKANDISFSCQSLSKIDKSVVHDIAMDNFCLLIYKVTDVEHFDYTNFPPKRTIYTYNVKTNNWNIQTANP